MKLLKKSVAILLAVVLTLTSVSLTAFAAEDDSEQLYKNFVILGDSLCLGFSTEVADMNASDTFDIISNVYRAANGHNKLGEADPGHDYTHAYPTVFAKRIGIDTFQNNTNKYVYTKGDAYDDVYNFGICAAWSTDMNKLLSNPYYVYDYYSANYDGDTTFVLPETYTGYRYLVDTTAKGYDVADPGTWVYRSAVVDTKAPGYDPDDPDTWTYSSGGEYVDYVVRGYDYETWEETWVIVYKMEEYTVPKGTAIKVATPMDYMGITYYSLNPIISEKYYYVAKSCLNEDLEFIDENNIVYYPAVLNEWTYQYEPDPAYKETLGEAVLNPQFTQFYYPYINDKIENGDLIALAIGGNDVYHSFQDEYMANDPSEIGQLLYMLTTMLQMGMTFSDITELVAEYGDMMGLEGLELGDLSDFLPEELSGLGDLFELGDLNLSGTLGQVALMIALASMIDEESIAQMTDYYSPEKVTAFEQKYIDQYKENYEQCIQKILAKKQDSAELVLVSQYNPVGTINYMNMLTESAESSGLMELIAANAGEYAPLLELLLSGSGDLETLTEDNYDTVVALSQDVMDAIVASMLEGDGDMTELYNQVSYPLAVMLIGEALVDTYEQLNDFIKEMADKYDLAYVDISEAPSSGRYDPHPTASGHKWIADKLYDAVVPTIEAEAVEETGSGTISNNGTTEYRLSADATYTFTPDDGCYVSAITVDGKDLTGEALQKAVKNGSYTFGDVKESHTISVTFDKCAKHEFDKGVVTPPTYEKEGYTTYTCIHCGYSYIGDKVPVLEREALAAPVLKDISLVDGKPNLSWDAVKGAAEYDIYRSNDGKEFEWHDTVSETSYTDGVAASGNTYYYKVVALSGSDKVPDSDYSNIKSVAVPANALQAPTLSITKNDGKVKLSWDEVDGAVKYEIYRSTDGKSYEYYGAASKLTYTNSKVTSGTKYYYKIVAVDAEGTASKYSNVKSTVPLTTPVLNSISNASDGIKLTWDAVKGADGYKVYRKSSIDPEWKMVKTIKDGSTTSWTNTERTNGAKYVYKIVAYKTVSGTTYTSTASATRTTYRLSRPTISSATSPSAGKITVKWNKNSQATGYQIKYVTGDTTKTVKVTSATTLSKTLSSLTKGAKYKVYVRSYKTVSDTNYYSAYSAYKSVTVAK